MSKRVWKSTNEFRDVPQEELGQVLWKFLGKVGLDGQRLWTVSTHMVDNEPNEATFMLTPVPKYIH